MKTKQNQTLDIYGTRTTTVLFGMLLALGAGVAGLNIASEVPAMTMSRHIVFGLVIGILSKPIFEVKK